MSIDFEKANLSHIDTIFSWLNEPHIQEFWDNSQAHKDDILNSVNGRKEPSSYCDGLYTYWVGSINSELYCLVMTLQEKPEYDMPVLKKAHLSKHGHTYSIDYMIGNREYFSKGLGAQTLKAFIDFMRTDDPKADTFFIDPDFTNPRARHVYEKAGFQYIGDFIMEGEGVFKGRKTHFLVNHVPLKVKIIPATVADYRVITEISINVWQQAYRGIIDQEFLDNISFEQRLNGRIKWMSESGRFSLVAVNRDKIIGFCDFGISRHPKYATGEIYAIYVLAEYQKSGIGGLLLKQALQSLTLHNSMPCCVIALEKNITAHKFYEKYGFVFVDKIITNMGGKEYLEKVYAFKGS